MKKAISFVICLSLMVTQSSLCLGEGYPAVSRDTLSTPSVFGPLGHAEHKTATLAMIALERDLLQLDKISDIDNVTSLEVLKKALKAGESMGQTAEYSEDTVHAPANISCFFDQIRQVGTGTNIFCIPVSVTKEGVRNDFKVLFSTVRKDGAFPSVICTDKELSELEEIIASQNAFPSRNDEDRIAMERYSGHERSKDWGNFSVDEWIKNKMLSGRYMINAKFYSDNKLLFKNANFVYDSRIQGALVSDSVEMLKRAGVPKNVLASLRAELSRKPLIILLRDDKEDLPQVTVYGENETSVPVRAHSSDYAVYIIVDRARVGAALNRDLVLYEDYKFYLEPYLKRAFLYEATVHLGFPGRLDGNGDLTNTIMEAIASGHTLTGEFPGLQYPGRLDHDLLARDYAAGEDMEALIKADIDKSIAEDKPIMLMQQYVPESVKSMRPKKVNKIYEAAYDNLEKWMQDRYASEPDLYLGFPDHLKKLVNRMYSAKTGRDSADMFVTGKDEAFKIIRRVRTQIIEACFGKLFIVSDSRYVAEGMKVLSYTGSVTYKDVLKLQGIWMSEELYKRFSEHQNGGELLAIFMFEQAAFLMNNGLDDANITKDNNGIIVENRPLPETWPSGLRDIFDLNKPVVTAVPQKAAAPEKEAVAKNDAAEKTILPEGVTTVGAATPEMGRMLNKIVFGNNVRMNILNMLPDYPVTRTVWYSTLFSTNREGWLFKALENTTVVLFDSSKISPDALEKTEGAIYVPVETDVLEGIKKITFEDQPREKMPIPVRKGFEHRFVPALLTALGDKIGLPSGTTPRGRKSNRLSTLYDMFGRDGVGRFIHQTRGNDLLEKLVVDDWSFVWAMANISKSYGWLTLRNRRIAEQFRQKRNARGHFARIRGRSPDDAITVIVRGGLAGTKFTLKDFHRAYDTVRERYPELGFAPLPDKRPDSQSRRDLKALKFQGYLKISTNGKAYVYSLTEKGAARAGLESALTELPGDFVRNALDTAGFLSAMSDLSGTKQLKDDKSVLIFSKRVTFDNGMGVYLPKLASAGIRMAVIMDENNTRQRKLIDEMNRSLPEELRITYASSVPEVMNMTRASRSYYYKIEGDPDAGIKGVVTFDITGIVRQIIEALGKAAGVIEDGLIERMHMAARRFAEAA